MTLAIALMVLLIVVVFGFVLEPIIRARRDRVEVDTVVIPDLPDFVALVEDADAEEEQDAEQPERSDAASFVEAERVEGSS